MDGAIIPTLKVTINGSPVEMHVNGDAIEGQVDRVLLRQGQNEIVFQNALPTGRQMGLLVSRVDLMPAR
jgi:hypothetical protein